MRRFWIYRLQSGALQFTIFISVIILLLLAGVILLAYTHRFFIEQSKAIVDNIQLADSGIIALQQQDSISTDTFSLSLKESRDEQTVRLHLSQWGIFEKGYVKSTHRKKEFTKCVLLGSGLTSVKRPSIYLNDHYNPLAVVGNTFIKGNAILPAQGVRPGNISGNSYYGKALINGEITTSTSELPKLKHDYKTQLLYYLKEYQPQNPESFIPLGQSRTIVNSFTQRTKGYYTDSPLILENVTIRGNIIIRSAKKIVIRKTAHLNDIIIIAPEIIVEDAVVGNFQAIADTKLKVGQECRLQYPSALIMLENANQISPVLGSIDQFNNQIFIDKGSIVKGTLCYFNSTIQERDFKVNVYLGEKSHLVGEVFCEGNIQLKAAAVSGSVYTNYFVSNEGGTIFVNHLYNSRIDSSELPENFGGILFDNQLKNVMQWLY